ncbi:hypothetical protein [Arsenicicoccus bolidensis]|uniref:hypothetical protein n=1 Tax=Arsenicicoccus bolidensis TaxID=229480 RepID=UPI0028B08214|nr:hypothetical protein [Arsenicicoccus bolidensis]
MTWTIDDDTVRALLTPGDAVGWMEEALARHHAGTLEAPPRLAAPIGGGRLVLTAGHSGDEFYGYRTYDTLPTTSDEQVTVAHDTTTGRVLAVHVGHALGACRTGALGGVATRHLGPGSDDVTVGIVGAGTQAWAQLWALTASLTPSAVRVTSRTPVGREAFADRARRELGLSTEALASPRDVVAGADVVILATTSSSPVIDAAWLEPDVLVGTVGPKQVGRAELAVDLVACADLVVTDSPAQLRAYDPPALVADAGMADRVASLGEIVAASGGPAAEGSTGPQRRGRRVYLSVGLAGTEVHLLGRLWEQHGRQAPV